MDLDEIKNKLQNTLDRSRFNHCLLVKTTAVKLAKIHGVNVKKAALAGFLHDCAKWMTKKQLIADAKKFRIKTDNFLLKIQPKLLHAPVSAVIAKKHYGVKGKDVLRAIAGHTSGRENMTLLEKIIYLADHTEPQRRYNNVDRARSLSRSNIDRAIALIATEMIRSLLKKNLPIYEQTIRTRNFYLRNEQNR